VLAADGAQENASAVNGDLDLVRVLEPANDVEVVADEP
jgi:hypothetical protein